MMTCKNWYRRFRGGELNLKGDALTNLKNLKRTTCSVYWIKIQLKGKRRTCSTKCTVVPRIMQMAA